MTTTPAIDIGIPGDQREAIAAGLARLLADTYVLYGNCLLYTSPSPRDRQKSRMPSSA